MPLGGETIGRAYVKILADGAGFSKDVKRQMREHDGDFDVHGKKAGKDFWDGFDEENNKRAGVSMKDLKKQMDHSAGRFQSSGDLLGNNFMEGLRKHLETRFKDVGTVIYANLNDELESGQIDFTGLMHKLKDLRPLVAKATKDIAGDQRKKFDELDRAVRRYGEGIDRSGRSRRDFLRELKSMSKMIAPTTRGYQEFNDKIGDLRRIVGNANPKLTKFKENMEKSGATVGKVFGKGSRNNFINWFGSLMGAVGKASRVLSSFTKWPGLVGEQIQKMAAKFQGAIDEAGSVRKALLNLASAGLPGLIAALITVSVTVQFVGASLGIFASAVVLLSGLVVALAGSIGFALAGAAAVAALAMLPLLAAVGAVAIGISDLNRHSKDSLKATANFKTLKKEWKSFRHDVTVGLFGKDMGGVKAFAEILHALHPLMTTAAKAVGGLLSSMGKAVQTKTFRDMLAQISKLLPPMIATLGHIGGNLVKFIGRAFIAAAPYITQLLGWLDKLTGKMAKSGKGGKKSPLADWFKKAWTSAKKVGGFVLQTIGLVSDLLGLGKNTGDNVFVKMTKWIKKIRKWLADPKNQKTIDKFFKDAEKLGTKIGEVITSVGGLVTALDTDANRTWLFMLLGIIDSILEKLTILAKAQGDTQAAMAPFPGWVKTTWGSIKDSVEKTWEGRFGDNVKYAIDTIKGWFTGLYDDLVGNSIVPDTVNGIVDWFGKLPGLIIAALGSPLGPQFSAWFSGLPAKARATAKSAAEGFSGLAPKIIGKAGSLISRFGSWLSALPGKSRWTANASAGSFAGLAGKMIGKAGSLISRFGAWVSALPGRARSLANAIAAAWSGLSGKMISKAGSLASRFSSWSAGVHASANRLADRIVDAFRGLAGRIVSAIGTIIPHFKMPHIPSVLTASGGVFSGAQTRIIGEAGPEAVVPLRRALSQVDPAVRQLSAFAQGLKVPNMASGGGNVGKHIDASGWTIITPTEDPRAVASEVVARMAAASYL